MTEQHPQNGVLGRAMVRRPTPRAGRDERAAAGPPASAATAPAASGPGARRITAADPSPDGAHFTAGDVVAGRYVIERLIARGGMGAVYRALQRPFSRRVALKVMHPELATSPDVRARFLQEARASSLLSHPNTITIFDFGRLDDGNFFIAMEYVDGLSLGQLLQREGALPLSRAVPLVIQIAQSLGEAHTKNIVHRDLKPDNVMITRPGDGQQEFVKVVDFGIAKLRHQPASVTHDGLVCGTPAYMAPEQARAQDVDARADLYALGCVMFEMLTGRPPYPGTSALEVMLQHNNDVIPHLPPEFPSSLDAFLQRALAKEPEDRPRDAATFAAELLASFLSATTPDAPRPDQPTLAYRGNLHLREQASAPRLAAPPTPDSASASAAPARQAPQVSTDPKTPPAIRLAPRPSTHPPADALPADADTHLASATTATTDQGNPLLTPDPTALRSEPPAPSVAPPAELTAGHPPSALPVLASSTDGKPLVLTTWPVPESRPWHRSTTPLVIAVALACLALGAGLALLASAAPADQEVSSADATVEIATAVVTFDSTPRGATVSLDDRAVGVTPLTLTLPRAERARVRYDLPGHEPITDELDLGRSARSFAALTPRQLRLELSAPFARTQIEVGELDLGLVAADRPQQLELAWPTEPLVVRFLHPDHEELRRVLTPAMLQPELSLRPSAADFVPRAAHRDEDALAPASGDDRSSRAGRANGRRQTRDGQGDQRAVDRGR